MQGTKKFVLQFKQKGFIKRDTMSPKVMNEMIFVTRGQHMSILTYNGTRYFEVVVWQFATTMCGTRQCLRKRKTTHEYRTIESARMTLRYQPLHCVTWTSLNPRPWSSQTCHGMTTTSDMLIDMWFVYADSPASITLYDVRSLILEFTTKAPSGMLLWAFFYCIMGYRHWGVCRLSLQWAFERPMKSDMMGWFVVPLWSGWGEGG